MQALTLGILLIAGSGEGTRRLLGFEKHEVARFQKFENESESLYAIHNGFRGETGDATEGRWALVRTLSDRYGFLSPGNRSTYYIHRRTGEILNTHGWFGKALPADWTGFDALRVDIKWDTVGMRVLVELEDDVIPDPVARHYRAPAGAWTTLEVDLKQAVRERRLDLKSMAALSLMAVETDRRITAAVVRVDNLRLVKAGTPNDLPILRDDTPMRPPPREPGKVTPLDPVRIEAEQPLSGKFGLIDFSAAPNWRKADYPLLMVKERCLGGFGQSGILLVTGASSARLSLDAGGTWQGLDGKPEPTRFLTDVRGHRATVLVDGRDIYVACVPNHCAGGGGRTDLYFTRTLWRDGRWTVGPQVTFETGIRHCADRLSLIKTATGRLWVAWDHLGRNAAYGIHAKYSDDGGVTWQDAGQNGLVGEEGGGIPGGPYLAEWEGRVVCVWRQNQVLLWSRFDGDRWSPPARIRGGEVPISVVSSGRYLYVATQRPDSVLRYDGAQWLEDAPPIRSGLLTRCGNDVICVATLKTETGSELLICRKAAEGPWTAPQTVAAEAETVEGVAVPQVSPAGFVPIAWSSASRRWIKVLAVPAGTASPRSSPRGNPSAASFRWPADPTRAG